MSDGFLKKILEVYKSEFKEHYPWFSPVKAATGGYAKTHQEATEHILWMLEQIPDFTSDAEKANRWIGFVQGVLWTAGFYTIDDMREHVTRCRTSTSAEE